MKCRKIVNGSANGEALVTTQAINFLTMIELKTGVVKDEKHELYGKSIMGKVLFFPNSIGSSVGAYSIYALKVNGVAPKAIACTKADITTASGCAIANIPLVDRIDVSRIKSGAKVTVVSDEDALEISNAS